MSNLKICTARLPRSTELCGKTLSGNQTLFCSKTCSSRESGKRRSEEINCKLRTKYLNDTEYRKMILSKNNKWRKENPEKYKQNIKNFHSANPEKKFEYSIMTKYGLTIERYNQMLNDQNNQCKICSINFTNETRSTCPNIDHNPETMIVRGLLCGPCNRKLGHLGDTYTKAVNYIKPYMDYLRNFDEISRIPGLDTAAHGDS